MHRCQLRLYHEETVTKDHIHRDSEQTTQKSVQNIRSDLVQSNKELQNNYEVIIQNRYNAVAKIQSTEEQWNMLKDSTQRTKKGNYI